MKRENGVVEWWRIVGLAWFLALLPVRLAGAAEGWVIIPEQNKPQITIETNRTSPVLVVVSREGIGSATIEAPATAPATITVRLRLRGLEFLQVSYSNVVLQVSVSSHGDNAVREYRRVEQREEPIPPGSRQWMKVRRRAEVIEVDLPAEFCESKTRRCQISWIDFYR
jgi:hypothetical protein